MRRYNYAPQLLERTLAALADRCALPVLRAPLAIVISACAAVAGTGGIELQRLRLLDRAVAVMSERAAANAANVQRLAVIDAERARFAQVEIALAEAHRAALAGINDLALLGNRLPAQTWLTRVHAGRDGTWAIEGRAGRIPEIAATLAGLANIDPAARVRLVSLANPAERARAIRFSIAWDRTGP